MNNFKTTREIKGSPSAQIMIAYLADSWKIKYIPYYWNSSQKVDDNRKETTGKKKEQFYSINNLNKTQFTCITFSYHPIYIDSIRVTTKTLGG